MAREQTLIPVDMDQEDVALRFQKYALVSAAVTDDAGRLVGMITVDDVVHIIQEEAGEDVLLLSGAGEGDINEPVRLTVRRRLFWLVINLGTAIIAASVVSLFQGEIGKYAVLAVLMPIVAGMGGNAGTQTLAVAVRALATNQLTESNTLRAFGRELTIALANGLSLGLLIGVGVALIFGVSPAAAARSMAAAMVINNLAAGLGGILVPVTLDRLRHRSGGVLGGVRDDDHRCDRLLQLPRPRGAGLASAAKPLRIMGLFAHRKAVPMLHLTKVAFGCRDLEALEQRIAGAPIGGEMRVATRMRPEARGRTDRRVAALDRQAPADRAPGNPPLRRARGRPDRHRLLGRAGS